MESADLIEIFLFGKTSYLFDMKVLWLASWYPSEFAPFEGDFIQRHARAVSELIPVHVVHVLQNRPRRGIAKSLQEHRVDGNLREDVFAFPFRSTGWSLLDKIRYNLDYRKYYWRYLESIFRENGLPNLVHVHVPVKAGIVAIRVLKKYRIPYILSEQSSHYEEASPEYFFNRSYYFQKITRKIFKKARAVTNVSATIGKKLQQIFFVRFYQTIHNLVDTRIFFFKPTAPGPRLRFIHVSTMSDQKNPEGIVEALGRLNREDWECQFCGPVPAGLTELIAQKGLASRIRLTGEIPYKRVAEKMQDSDALILFSWHENFPCVAVEALCSGLPVIATRTGGLAEAVDASNGILIQPGNVEELKNAMQQVLDRFGDFDRAAISREATRQYNREHIAGQFVKLYQEILNNDPTDKERLR
jgi:glycosyltransferase involved in cell wall biosynthesis